MNWLFVLLILVLLFDVGIKLDTMRMRRERAREQATWGVMELGKSVTTDMYDVAVDDGYMVMTLSNEGER